MGYEKESILFQEAIALLTESNESKVLSTASDISAGKNTVNQCDGTLCKIETLIKK